MNKNFLIVSFCLAITIIVGALYFNKQTSTVLNLDDNQKTVPNISIAPTKTVPTKTDLKSERKSTLIKTDSQFKYYLEWDAYQLPNESAENYFEVYRLNTSSKASLKAVDFNGKTIKTANLEENVSDEFGNLRMSVSAPQKTNLVTLEGYRPGTDGIETFIIDLNEGKIIDTSTKSTSGY